MRPFNTLSFSLPYRFAWLVLASLTELGCGTTLIHQPIERRGDGWTIVLERLIDGPNEVRPMGYTIYHPEEGERFLHAYFKFRNDGPKERLFGYNACDMDLGSDRVLPGLIIRYNGVGSAVDRNETYKPGETSYRRLTFSYPEGRLPSRIRCAFVSFEVPRDAR